MKELLKKKWFIVIALSVVTCSLLFVSVHVYGMNKEHKETLKQTQTESKRKTRTKTQNDVYRALNGTSASTVDNYPEVAVPVDPSAEAPEEETAAIVPEGENVEVPAAEEVNLPQTEPAPEIPSPEVPEEAAQVEEPAAVEENNTDSALVVYDVLYSASDLRFHGVIYAGEWRWTWYSQNVLPGGGLSIPGRHVDENGFVCDENDRICLASSDLEYGTVVATPFGKEGCVYDCGCDSGTLDVYVDF